MFSGLAGEKALFRPFTFKMFAGLDICTLGRHRVAVQSVEVRLGRRGIINPFLLRVRGNEAKDRARSSAGVLPIPIAARASPEWNEGRPYSVGHPDSPPPGVLTCRPTVWHQSSPIHYRLSACRCQEKLLTVMLWVTWRSANGLGF